jgi:hypothetical protein
MMQKSAAHGSMTAQDKRTIAAAGSAPHHQAGMDLDDLYPPLQRDWRHTGAAQLWCGQRHAQRMQHG